MNNLFSPTDMQDILRRIENIQPDAQRQWGQMEVVQMLNHCTGALKMASGEINPPRAFIGRLIGRFFRSKYSNKEPFEKNSPTSRAINKAESLDFDREKAQLISQVQKFHQGGAGNVTTHPHPFFGELTPDEWSIGMWKHLDHHLRQFGG